MNECVGFDLPIDCSEQQVCELVKQMNDDPKINGIMIQLPLPQHFNENKILDLIDPKKDVDGFHPVNIGNLALKGRDPDFISCTPLAVYELLKEYLGNYCCKSGDFSDQNITICGKSNIVGMPLSLLLSKNNATVSLCHSKTKNIEDFVRQADILITAIGQKHFFKGEWIKEGAIVIDVGINVEYEQVVRRDHNNMESNEEQKLEDQQEQQYESVRRVYGDVEFHKAIEKSSYITPVPGGVGPMTIAMLMKNVVTSWQRTNNSM